MSHIFISYRREESVWETGRIYDYMERKFGTGAIFKDVDTIALGDNFRDRIQEAVGQCQILLAVIGRRWLQVHDVAGRRRLDDPTDWVRLEIETALERKVRVIPVLLDDVKIPDRKTLPESLQPLCDRHAANVRHDPDFRRDMERMLKVIAQHLKATEPQAVDHTARLFAQLFDRAVAKQKAGDLRGAIADYSKAIRLNPNDATGYYNRGNANYDLDDKLSALADYEQAIQRQPDYIPAHYNRGIVKDSLGDQQEALASYKRAIQLTPHCAEDYYKQGNARYDLGDKRGALADYTQAIQLDPGHARAHSNLGFVKYSHLGDAQGALADYNKAIQLDPGYARAHFNRGNIRYDMDDDRGALAD